MKYRPEYDPRVIGKKLKRLREAKNLSVNEVRKYLRLSKQAVYNYESGKRYPQSDTMFALMELYEADLHETIDEHVEEAEIMVTNIISLEERGKRQMNRLEKYARLSGKYYKAG